MRAGLRYDGQLSDEIRSDACRQTGVHPAAFRSLFPTDDALYDRIAEELAEDCELRLRAAVARFATAATGTDALVAAAVCLAECRPLDRVGLVIRGGRRLAALRTARASDSIVATERQLASASTEILQDLLGAVGRTFSWPPQLAVRIIFDSYERSFEAWTLRGGDDGDFETSPFVRRTLPHILERMSSDA